MLNTRLRTAGNNEFERDFFKLFNSSIFGKTIENIRNHKERRTKRNTKFALKPKFKDGCPFLKEFFVVEKRKTEIWMNKPVYLGQAILDLSRMLMHEFHSDYM